MERHYLNPAGIGSHCGEFPTERGTVTGLDPLPSPCWRDSRLLRAGLGSSAPRLCAWPYYISPASGAVVLYLSLATIFASAYALFWELSPDAFANLVVKVGGPQELGAMLYFSLTTLTTTGYGVIVAVDPLARSLANWRR
jgi:hypothetical protein